MDRGDGACLDEDAALAGCIDAHVAIALGQCQDAETGAKALFGMRPIGDDGLEEGGGGEARRPRSVPPASTCRSGDARLA